MKENKKPGFLGRFSSSLCLAIKAAKEFERELEKMDEMMMEIRILKYQGGIWSYME